MANASIGGLASGLDTATIIDQFMSIEAVPQTKLKTSLSTQQRDLKTLQDLNARIASLATTAKALTTDKAWQPLTATSSSTALVATAATGSASGSYEVTVNRLASTHRLTFGTSVASTASVVTGPVTLTRGGESQTITPDDDTLAGLVSALNRGGTGVRATTVKLDDGTQRLMVTSVEPGAGASFTLSGVDGLGTASVRAGADAEIQIGQDTVHSKTNTFSGVVPGLTLTATAAAVGQTVQVEVATDTSSMQNKVKALVDQVNAALSTIDSLTNYDAGTKTSGPLAGDSAVRSLRNALLDSIYPADGSSLASIGLQTDRSGKLVLDSDAFGKAYAADPAKITAAFTAGTTASPADGFAERLRKAAAGASDSYTGTLTSAITGRGTAITRTQGDISAWDTRLEMRRTTLTRQFTAMETALNQMNSQSQWLAGQISSLAQS
ncbi:flagellar hook-associated protein 2 [Nocardioides scoriae]|uniref:Flagellar hook-associated protein 2 n=1 Tax=Nocardioides scoriae TaxID=642780 RepID=A0A1H1S513_9ACTN|nr:flagellar filament capping protein FliD [Nocardioides scoriae]SDS43180.1 flagellar hook-associated protein 2 [Nocardioides scoriae]